MRPELRRWLLGGGLLLVLVTGAWFWARPAVAPPGSVSPGSRNRTAGAPETAAEPLMPVRLDALGWDRDEPAETARNPFRFQPKVVPAPVRPATAQPPTEERPIAPPGPPPAPAPAPLPPIPLKFIGVVEKATGVKWAVLSDGRLTLHGREGDIIAGQYRIVKIGLESIELAYPDGRGRQTVKLSGQ